MRLTKVTITGADNSTNPNHLVALTKEYPFVEWGILFGTDTLRTPRPRFPDAMQADAFVEALGPAHLSAHLCGKYVRDLVIDGNENALDWFASDYGRIQLNFHGQFHKAHPSLPEIINTHSKQRFILQCDGVNDEAAKALCKTTLSGPLFDRSGGAGILPTEWPKAWSETFCGYAGGLSADNVQEQLLRIAEAAGDEQIWIDVETRVRTADDKQLDMEEVNEFLYYARPFVWKEKK